MAHIEQVFRAILTGDAGFSALAGTRVYPGVLPSGATLPAGVFQAISRVPTRILEGDQGRIEKRIQLSCWAATYAAALALARTARVALVDKSGLLGNSPDTMRIGTIRLENEIDDFDRDPGADDRPEGFRVIQDYVISYTEE